MKKVYGDTGAKTVAAVLFVLLLCLLFADCVYIVKGFSFGCYGTYNETDFYNSTGVYSIAWRKVNEYEFYRINNLFYSEDDYSYSAFIDSGEFADYKQTLDSEFGGGKTNLILVLSDEQGNRLYSNGDESGCAEIATTGYGRIHMSMYLKDITQSGIKDEFSEAYEEYVFVLKYRYVFFYVIAILSLLWVVDMGYMLYCAGHNPLYEGITLRFYDKIPTDVFLALYAAITAGCVLLAYGMCYMTTFSNVTVLWLPFVAVASVLLLPLLTSIARRLKAHTFIKNTVIYLILRGLFRLLKIVILHIPMCWKAAVSFICYLVVNMILVALYRDSRSYLVIMNMLSFNSAVLVYLCWRAVSLTRLKNGIERIYIGDFETKTGTDGLMLGYRETALRLNNIGDGLNRAVAEKTKSERMKTELITNVSHDIKTPLTSIINYVGLLKSEGSGSPKADEYIEVIDRQSQKLKKLTEDLVYAAKASSGTVSVSLEKIDVSEFIGQVEAEYSEKLENAGLTLVSELPGESGLSVVADGRLLWRVADNIFGNVCKYSLSGTRVYVSADDCGDSVEIMVRNISKDPLNISAEELMQRFVRGDTSRTGEGSGLGLAIAKDLTALQGGSFSIFIDGDLFRASVSLKKYNDIKKH